MTGSKEHAAKREPFLPRPYEPGVHEPPSWAAPFLSVGSVLFDVAVRIRRAAYERGIIRVERCQRPVISVGNLTAGGNGKTPFVILLAKLLCDRGLRVAVLSRGYGGRKSRWSRPSIVSTGEGPIARAEDVGDEPVLIARSTRAAVVVARDRALAATSAIEDLGADVLILDDGFQHLRLARDLDFVLLDAERPFGSGRLLPHGTLRERPDALLRASLLVFNHGSSSREGVDLGPETPAPLRARLDAIPRIEIAVEPTMVGPWGGGARAPANSIAGHRVALLAAIARPERFEESVRGLGATVVHRTFYRDHAWLSVEDVAAFARAASSRGAEILLTTEKDAARLAPGSGEGLQSLAIEHRILSGGAALHRMIDAIIESAKR